MWHLAFVGSFEGLTFEAKTGTVLESALTSQLRCCLHARASSQGVRTSGIKALKIQLVLLCYWTRSGGAKSSHLGR